MLTFGIFNIKKRINNILTSLNKRLHTINRNVRKQVIFPNKYFKLMIPSVLEKTNCPIFHVPLEMSKPQIKEYLENYYGLEIKRVHTLIQVGKVKRNRKTKRLVKRPSYKKAFVYLKDFIDLKWNEDVKKNILRYYDRRLSKKFKMEEEAKKIRERMQQQTQPNNQ
jgi:ribosomal protein L23